MVREPAADDPTDPGSGDAPQQGPGVYVADKDAFERDTRYIGSRITRDGRDGYPVEPGRYQRLRADERGPLDRVGRPPPSGRTRPVSGRPTRGDGRADGRHLPRREQRRLPLRLRRLPTGVRGRLRPVVLTAGRAVAATRDPSVPHGRPHHRRRHPAVHHVGPLRSRVPRSLQVQPPEALGDAGALGLCP